MWINSFCYSKSLFLWLGKIFGIFQIILYVSEFCTIFVVYAQACWDNLNHCPSIKSNILLEEAGVYVIWFIRIRVTCTILKFLNFKKRIWSLQSIYLHLNQLLNPWFLYGTMAKSEFFEDHFSFTSAHRILFNPLIYAPGAGVSLNSVFALNTRAALALFLLRLEKVIVGRLPQSNLCYCPTHSLSSRLGWGWRFESLR